MTPTQRDIGSPVGGRWLSRRAALRRLGIAGAVATAAMPGARPTGAIRREDAGPSRAEAQVLARGIADALASDPARLGEWVAEDVVGHVPLAPVGSGKGLAGLMAKAAVAVAALPDATITVAGLAVDGETVSARGEIRGTHTGDVAGFPATGESLRIQYVIFTRVVDGKVVEYWYQLDVLGALGQLGLFSFDIASDGDA